MAPPRKSKAQKVVVDECVGRSSLLWQAFEGWLGDRPTTLVELATQHEGIPDGAILSRLLSAGDILVTADRVLHNRACADGIRSFTLDPSGRLTDKPLANVPRRPRIAPAPAGDLKDDYIHEVHAVTQLLRRGMGERELKGYRTRRRRIRNLLGGRDNINQLALTVGDLPVKDSTLCGFFLRVAGHGRKGLDATEGYCVDRRAGHDPAVCAIHALMDVYLLDLDGIRTDAFFLSESTLDLCRRLVESEEPAEAASNERSLYRLLGGLDKLTLHPCQKGPFRDAMVRKLGQLARGGSNEVKPFDAGDVAGKLFGGVRA